MSIYLIVVISIILLGFIIDYIVELLNLRHTSQELPQEMAGFYDSEKYLKSQNYLADNTKFHLVSTLVSTPLILAFILLKGFYYIDTFARSFQKEEIVTGLIFVGSVGLISWVVGQPFSIYHTFVLENKYGFNRTTWKTYMADQIKSIVLIVLIGGGVFALIQYFFLKTGSMGWLYCWLALTALQIFMMFIAPAVIMPLFNKFEPLEKGELNTAITAYANKIGFPLRGVYKMDGSKRSSKANAFFTGFGRFRRIVLFDTLIEKHTTQELVAVLAHEMGHFKKRHIHKMMLFSIINSAIMLYLLSFVINSPGLANAFGLEKPTIYSGMVFFSFLYQPISFFLSIISSIMSRRHEYEADRFAAETGKDPGAMITALKKLSADSLSNLTPHPLKVFLEYSHPPILQRIAKLKGE